jgi:hypothetical protein
MIDRVQTKDGRRAASTEGDAARPGALTPSHIRSRMGWGKHRSLAPSSVPTSQNRRFGVTRSLQTLLRRVRDDSLLRNSLFIMLTTIVNSAFGLCSGSWQRGSLRPEMSA